MPLEIDRLGWLGALFMSEEDTVLVFMFLFAQRGNADLVTGDALQIEVRLSPSNRKQRFALNPKHERSLNGLL